MISFPGMQRPEWDINGGIDEAETPLAGFLRGTRRSVRPLNGRACAVHRLLYRGAMAARTKFSELQRAGERNRASCLL